MQTDRHCRIAAGKSGMFGDIFDPGRLRRFPDQARHPLAAGKADFLTERFESGKPGRIISPTGMPGHDLFQVVDHPDLAIIPAKPVAYRLNEAVDRFAESAAFTKDPRQVLMHRQAELAALLFGDILSKAEGAADFTGIIAQQMIAPQNSQPVAVGAYGVDIRHLGERFDFAGHHCPEPLRHQRKLLRRHRQFQPGYASQWFGCLTESLFGPAVGIRHSAFDVQRHDK